jgi:putative oxidoreductase
MAPLPEETISSRSTNNHGVDGILFRLTHSARVLFGLILFANGLNWWWKILPYPNMHDHANHALPHTPPFVQAMLNTGFMFDFVRIIEVTAGAGLLMNCWTPFLLVFVFPLSLGIWAVDIFLIASSLRANVMGWAVFSLNGFLLVSYLDRYVPMLTRTAVPGLFWRGRKRQSQE